MLSSLFDSDDNLNVPTNRFIRKLDIYLSSLIFIQISCPASTAQLPGAGVWLNSPRWARRCCYFTRVVNWCCQAGSW